jgi:hypothetical protein
MHKNIVNRRMLVDCSSQIGNDLREGAPGDEPGGYFVKRKIGDIQALNPKPPSDDQQ